MEVSVELYPDAMIRTHKTRKKETVLLGYLWQ
jgi:hypothetical protein